MSIKKDLSVKNPVFSGAQDKISELSSKDLAENPRSGLMEDMKQLLFLGKISREVKIGDYIFKIESLTEERQRSLINKIMKMSDQEKVTYAKVYSVCEAVTHVNEYSIDLICEELYGEHEDVDLRKVLFFGQLQAFIIDKIFLEYEKLLDESRDAVGYEEVKK